VKAATAAILIASLGLTACDYIPFTPQNRIADAKAKIAINSADPTTVRWSDVKAGPGGAVCGVYNAQQKGGSYGTEIVWSGAVHFVTIDGEPTAINRYSDCEKEVAPWSRCSSQGNEGTVRTAIQNCRAAHAEMDAQNARDVADRMTSDGLIATGDANRDQASWDAHFGAARIATVNVYDDSGWRLRRAAGDIWKTEYNRIMRQLPRDATKAQKVAAAQRAAVAATDLSEAYLRDHGVA
jgi:ribosomal protein S20